MMIKKQSIYLEKHGWVEASKATWKMGALKTQNKVVSLIVPQRKKYWLRRNFHQRLKRQSLCGTTECGLGLYLRRRNLEYPEMSTAGSSPGVLVDAWGT